MRYNRRFGSPAQKGLLQTLMPARTIRRLSEMREFVAVFVIAFYLIGFIIRRDVSFVKRNFKIYRRLFCRTSIAKGEELCYYKRGKGEHRKTTPPARSLRLTVPPPREFAQRISSTGEACVKMCAPTWLAPCYLPFTQEWLESGLSQGMRLAMHPSSQGRVRNNCRPPCAKGAGSA